MQSIFLQFKPSHKKNGRLIGVSYEILIHVYITTTSLKGKELPS